MSKRAVNLLRNMAVPMKRDGNNPNYGFVGVKTTTANTTLTAADSGKVIFLDGSTTHDVTLPSAATGLNYHFILVDATADVDIVQAAATEDFVGTVVDGAGSSDTALAGDTKIIFSQSGGAAAGDWVKLVCYNDDDWMVAGNCDAAGGVVFG
jgi:hypothetical protein